MTLSRRNLLKSGAILSATGLLPLSAAAQAQQELPKALQALRPLGDRVKPVTPDEFRARVARAQKLMTDSNAQISALYLTPGTSLYYFSGIRWGIIERLLALAIRSPRLAGGRESLRSRGQMARRARHAHRTRRYRRNRSLHVLRSPARRRAKSGIRERRPHHHRLPRNKIRTRARTDAPGLRSHVRRLPRRLRILATRHDPERHRGSGRARFLPHGLARRRAGPSGRVGRPSSRHGEAAKAGRRRSCPD